MVQSSMIQVRLTSGSSAIDLWGRTEFVKDIECVVLASLKTTTNRSQHQ